MAKQGMGEFPEDDYNELFSRR